MQIFVISYFQPFTFRHMLFSPIPCAKLHEWTAVVTNGSSNYSLQLRRFVTSIECEHTSKAAYEL